MELLLKIGNFLNCEKMVKKKKYKEKYSDYVTYTLYSNKFQVSNNLLSLEDLLLNFEHYSILYSKSTLIS